MCRKYYTRCACHSTSHPGRLSPPEIVPDNLVETLIQRFEISPQFRLRCWIDSRVFDAFRRFIQTQF